MKRFCHVNELVNESFTGLDYERKPSKLKLGGQLKIRGKRTCLANDVFSAAFLEPTDVASLGCKS